MFSGKGEKFTEALEREVEAIIDDRSWQVAGSADAPVDQTDVIDAYIAHARLALPDPQRLGRFKLAIDTANGATTTVAPRLFAALGFDLTVLIAANRTAATSTSIAGRRIPSRCPRPCARTGAAWASRSTATATAPSSSMRPGASWTATPSC